MLPEGGQSPILTAECIETMQQPDPAREMQADTPAPAKPEGRAVIRPCAVIRKRKSPVRKPAATVSISTLRELETFLRKQAGFSRAEAKRIAKHGFEGRKVAQSPDEELAGLLRQNIELLQAKGRNDV